ncbi:MAG: hypothetical protein GEU87_13610 [Alphaproteobacteria bacterium]|nr:hypothetical protein [Alphaproteobacteria bacterium]
MLHDASTGSVTAGRGLARSGGVWEIVGILAAVIPCGILAGLYLATGDMRFLAACIALAIVAVVLIFIRGPRRVSLARRGAGAGGGATGFAGKLADRFRGSAKLAAAGSAVRRTFTLQVLKLLGFAVWMIAWGVTAAFYARVAENTNITALMMLVVFGGFSPVVIYYGLESGMKKLGHRLRDDE